MTDQPANIEDTLLLSALIIWFWTSIWTIYELTGSNWQLGVVYLGIAGVCGFYLWRKRTDWSYLIQILQQWRKYLL